MKNRFFEEYVSNFDMNNPKIDLKYHHTYRVVDYCTKLAKSLNLNEHDTKLAEIVGLLHDIARFPQARDFDTFNDSISFDHGDKGAEILEKDNYVMNYVDTEEDKNIVIKAVRYHNKKYLEANLTDRERLFCNIIRDADKLDIMDKQGMKHEDGSTEFNPLAYEEIINKKLITYTYVNNDATNILKTLAYIFDYNYKESFNQMKEHQMIERKFKLLEDNNVNKEQVEKVEKIITEYIEERTK